MKPQDEKTGMIVTDEEKELYLKKLATVAQAGEMMAAASIVNDISPDQLQFVILAYAKRILNDENYKF